MVKGPKIEIHQMDFSTTKVQSLSIIVFFSQRKWYWMWSNFHDQKLIQVSDNLLLSCWLSASLQIISFPLSDVFFCSLPLLFFETDKRSCSTLKLLTAFTNILFKANVPKYVQASLHRCAFSWTNIISFPQMLLCLCKICVEKFGLNEVCDVDFWGRALQIYFVQHL